MEVLGQTMTIEQAIALIWAAVADGRAKNVYEAARTLWPEIVSELSDDDREELVIKGLGWCAREAGHPKQGNISPMVPYGAPHGDEWERYATLSFPYLGVERQKMLIDFTLEDWEAFENRMKGAVIAAAERVRMAKKIRAILVEKGKRTVRGLDAKTRDEIEQLARSTLRVYAPDPEGES